MRTRRDQLVVRTLLVQLSKSLCANASLTLLHRAFVRHVSSPALLLSPRPVYTEWFLKPKEPTTSCVLVSILLHISPRHVFLPLTSTSVYFPHCLLHFLHPSDQNEKARSRYGFYMSAGVDAYSRMFAWLCVHNNRCMYTWALCYLRAVLECGGWCLVSVDGGGENNVMLDIQVQ